MNDRNFKAMEWFAVGADGNSVLRVAPGLALGESDTGALTLNDADSEWRWVEFEEHAGGTWLEASDRAVMTGEDGIPLPGAFLQQGMVLRLPNNELYISRDISLPEQAGPVLAVAPVHTDDRLKAGAADIDEDREAASGNRIPPRGAEVLGAIDDLPREISGRRAASGADEALSAADRVRAVGIPPAATSAPQPAVLRRPGRSRRIRRRRGRRGGAPVVATALLVVGIVALPMLAPDIANRLRQAMAEGELFAKITAGQTPATPAEDISVVIPEIPPPPVTRRQPALPDRAKPGDAGGEAEVVATTVAADDAQDRADAAVEARLARARDLLYEGNVTYPPGDNAVDLLTDVLANEPSHPGARLLLEECSQRLTQTAQRLHENGLHYEARNTLEEVLNFDPDSARARSLLRRWVGSKS